MKSLFALLFLAFFIVLLPAKELLALSDQILAAPEEVWDAAYAALKPQGIRAAKKEKGKLESSWIEDYVTRGRGMFKEFLKSGMKRRYRFKVMITEDGIYSNINIEGVYQEKSTSATPGMPWRSFKPDSQDYRLELELFHDILSQLELKRNAVKTAGGSFNKVTAE